MDIRTPKLYGVGDSKSKFGPNADDLSLDYKGKYFLKIPLAKLSRHYTKIPRDRKIVVYDYHGKQSWIAAKFLLNKGFKEVYLLNVGIRSVSD